MRLQGTIARVDAETQRYEVVYDDDVEEWLQLRRERFEWLSPRATSAGCTLELMV